jgi:type II secretory pathway pseudopilin PulG
VVQRGNQEVIELSDTECSEENNQMIRRRAGFTLVEILVAMALTVFVLTILAQAFAMGVDTFRTLKAVGDLNESLRTATTMMRSDLAADHFEGKRRLSDTRFKYDGPPQQGYLFLSAPASYIPETGPDVNRKTGPGTDADGLFSYRNTGATILAFTVKAKGNRPQNFFSMPSGPSGAALSALGSPDSRFQQSGTFSSQWAEVCYFLVKLQNPDGTLPATAGGTPLYALYRQQRLVVANVDQLNWVPTSQISVANITTYLEKVSCQRFPQNPNPAFAGHLYFNSPADLTIPQRRTSCNFQKAGKVPVPPAPQLAPQLPPPVPTPFVVPGTTQLTGEDLLLQDVLSFDVKVLTQPGADFIPLPAPGIFDTWSTRRDDVYDYSTLANPSPIVNLYGLQITLRVWHPDARLARQITFVQEL